MEYAHKVLPGTGIHNDYADDSELLFVDIAVVDQSYHPAFAYYLPESAFSTLIQLGTVTSFCRHLRRIYLINGAEVSYKRLVIITGQPNAEKLDSHAIDFALRCHDISSMIGPSETTELTHLPAGTSVRLNPKSLYSEGLIKEINTPEMGPSSGLNSGINRLYQVQN